MANATDARSIPSSTTVEADVVVIGFGPAGLAVASELLGTDLRIVAVETGDEMQSPEAEELSQIEFVSAHFADPVGIRRRQLAGMATTWTQVMDDGSPAARYLPLEPIDFEERPWVPNSGWPIVFSELTPFYTRAREMCALPPFDFEVESTVYGAEQPISVPGSDVVTRFDQFAPASAFTETMLDSIRRAPNVTVMTNATVMELRPQPDVGRVTSVIRGIDGREFSVSGRAIVLAGGAIETARLLLNSPSAGGRGLGNEHDVVGRYYMDHPRVSFGYGSFLRPPRHMGLYQRHLRDGQLLLGKLTISDAAMRRERLLNGNLQIFPHYLSLGQVRAVRSTRECVRSIRARDAASSARQLATLARWSLPTAGTLALAARRQRRLRPDMRPTTWPALDDRLRARSFKIDYQPEQCPVPENRVTLADRTDRFGYAIAQLRWQWSALDLDSIRRTREIVARELENSGFGVLESASQRDALPESEVNGPPMTAHHHLGGARMHNDPRRGVVDRECRLHGEPTVFVAGGSVFPTVGYANPTLTIIALAIRLGDYLKREM